MPRRTSLRLKDIARAIANLRKLMSGRTRSDLSDDLVRAAFERLMEIISEASRHVPAEMKDQYQGIPWRDIANFGNIIRHVYHRVDFDILWQTYSNDIDPLDLAVADLLSQLPDDDPSF